MCISVILARGLVAEVERRGLDWRDLLKRSGVAGERLDDLREMLTLSEVDALIHNAITLTEEPALGLAIAQHAPDSMLQVLGQLVNSQTTLRTAFAALNRYSALVAEGLTWHLEEHDELASFSIGGPDRGDTTRCLMELALVMAYRVGRKFLPEQATLHELHLAHEAPSYVAMYEALFQCPVRFGQPRYGLVFSRAYLDVEQHHADSTVRVASEALAERVIHERMQALSTADRVLQVLRSERDWDAVDTGRVAERLGLTVRSLRRRLASEGALMSDLLDQSRCRIACEELSRADASVKATAELLGFSEPSAFHRAFRRWTGRTPGQYIKYDRWHTVEQLEQLPRRVVPSTRAQKTG